MTPAVRTDVPLGPLTTLGVGGPARELVTAETERDLVDAVREADDRGAPLLVLGGGSNLLVADRGFAGRVVRVATRGVSHDPAGDRVAVTASAGEPWDAFVAACVAENLAGLECLSGIPGLAGATPIQNVGAYGQEVADTVTHVRAWDRLAREVVTLPAAACGFAYRDSHFKGAHAGRYVVLAVTFALSPSGAPSLRYGELTRALAGEPAPSLARVREAILTLRRAKSMVLDPRDPETRSAGSFFTNPIVDVDVADRVEALARASGALREGESMPRFAAPHGRVKLAAGWLIERAGVTRGETSGRAAVSRSHALALVAREGCTAAEVVALARSVQRRVSDRWGVALAPEPVQTGFAAGEGLG
ncbi:MAG: UDP-N-acetylmuramate dehydrogenase [Polyangiales bacterium]